MKYNLLISRKNGKKIQYLDKCFICGKEKWVYCYNLNKKCKKCALSELNSKDNWIKCGVVKCVNLCQPDKVYCKNHRKYNNKDNIIKMKARWAVQRSLLNKTIRREPCEVCGSLSSEAHHEDYNSPLLVKWLCKQHHLLRHKGVF